MIKGFIILFIMITVILQIYIIKKGRCEVKKGNKITIDTTNNVRISGTVVKTSTQGVTIKCGEDVYIDWKNIKFYKIYNN